MKIDWRDYVEERPEVLAGKPVFKGTRLSVEYLLRQIGSGMTNDELLQQYPSLKPEHLRAAALFAADAVVTK